MKTPNDQQTLSPDTVFDVLRNPRRQFVLAYLRQQNHPVTLTELARQTTAWEADVPVSEVDGESMKPVYTSLSHAQLPKLVDHGLLEYTSDDRRTVDTTGRMRILEADFDFTALVEPQRYYTE
ncbi:hypothetical protein [Haladaptatus sp. T7]|uniref:DUF7344 domain-containing protein n=1 Tax=Haladaptatus sp. T7 TaxID=2029368 RepID=UPI0021A258B1|nr:hypothetical protein [Haladaptatus sp. T7]GKZ15391.1 hypothetical protein HAL_32720 [Haladaptatus sp. T7]